MPCKTNGNPWNNRSLSTIGAHPTRLMQLRARSNLSRILSCIRWLGNTATSNLAYSASVARNRADGCRAGLAIRCGASDSDCLALGEKGLRRSRKQKTPHPGPHPQGGEGDGIACLPAFYRCSPKDRLEPGRHHSGVSSASRRNPWRTGIDRRMASSRSRSWPSLNVPWMAIVSPCA